MSAVINWICQDWVQEVAKALFYGVIGAEIVLLINDWKRFKAEEAEEKKADKADKEV